MASAPLPLFRWQHHAELERLQTERETLLKRISKLPQKSYRRFALEERLRALTLRQLEIEARMGGGGG